MSEPRTHAAAATAADFTEHWRTVSKYCRSKTLDNNKTAKQAGDTTASVMCKGEDADQVKKKIMHDLLLQMFK